MSNFRAMLVGDEMTEVMPVAWGLSGRRVWPGWFARTATSFAQLARLEVVRIYRAVYNTPKMQLCTHAGAILQGEVGKGIRRLLLPSRGLFRHPGVVWASQRLTDKANVSARTILLYRGCF